MIDDLIGRGVRNIANRLGWRIPPIVFIVASIIWLMWELIGHASVFDWAIDKWQRLHGEASASVPSQPALQHQLYAPLALFFVGLLWLTALLVWPTVSVKQRSLLRRVRSLLSELTAFIEKNEGNVFMIHYGYQAHFRHRVDQLFSELAAEEIYIVAEDWEVNPATQTASNIRENVISRLTLLADRLEAKQSAPRSRLVGEIEDGKFGISGTSTSYGSVRHNVAVYLTLRVTKKVNIETTLKRAILRITVNGHTYTGHKQSLWALDAGPDLLQKITNKTPIRHGPATTGSLEFNVEGLERPRHGLAADVSVTLVDEFDVPHVIRNRNLWIAA
jgi:hypothetical protein